MRVKAYGKLLLPGASASIMLCLWSSGLLPWVHHKASVEGSCLFSEPLWQIGNRVISSWARGRSGWMHTQAIWHRDVQSGSLTGSSTLIQKTYNVDTNALLCVLYQGQVLLFSPTWLLWIFYFICSCPLESGQGVEGTITSHFTVGLWSLLKMQFWLRPI